MRTAAIDAACGRFEEMLSPRLGPALAVRETRVTFDSKGWCVRCWADSPDGPLELRLAAPESDGEAFSWHLDAGRERPSGWRSALDETMRADAVVDALTSLRQEVAPRAHSTEPLDARRARDLLGPEGAMIARGVDAFARCYGAPLTAVWLDGDETPSVGFPMVVSDQELLMYAPPPFREDAHTIAYLEDLGYAVDAHARVSTVPVPSVFTRRRARLGVDGGLRPELQRRRTTLFSPHAWLKEISSGVFPVNVHGGVSGALASLRPLHLPRAMTAYLDNHFHALGHDLGVHTLAMHRVPASQMAELRRLARVALRRGIGPARRAASFFEERLTRACMETWAVLIHPSEFAARFDEIFQTLRSELAREVFARG